MERRSVKFKQFAIFWNSFEAPSTILSVKITEIIIKSKHKRLIKIFELVKFYFLFLDTMVSKNKK